MKKFKISPSILASNFENLKEVVKKLEKAKVDLIHIDVMDGHFVPNITVGPFFVENIKNLTNIPLDVHLMIKNPEKYYEKFIKAGADWLIIHYEALCHHDSIMKDIRKKGAKNGIAINPSTPVFFLKEIFPYADLVLVMGVNPGFSGQKIIPQTINKVQELKKIKRDEGYNFEVAFDGGVNLDNAKEILEKGCDILMIGSALFNSEDLEEKIEKFRRIEVI